MSKLTIVRQVLETNPEVVIVNTDERNHLPDRLGFCHTVDYRIAPKNGLYTADELQEFMVSLVPEGLEPTMKDDFYQHGKGGLLNFGKLYFDEKIGEERITRICTLTDEELLNVSGFVDGRRTIEETHPYTRRTWVRPFPNERFIRDVLNGELEFSEYSVTSRVLEDYKPKSTRKSLLGALHLSP